MLSEIGMMHISISQKVMPNCHIHIIQRLRDIFHHYAFAEINQPNIKLRTFKHLKTIIGTESYINAIRRPKERFAISKFRLPYAQTKSKTRCIFLLLCEDIKKNVRNCSSKLTKRKDVSSHKQ